MAADHRLAAWRQGAVAGSSASLIAIVCLLLIFVRDSDHPSSVERATAEQFASSRTSESTLALASGKPPSASLGVASASHAEAAVAALLKASRAHQAAHQQERQEPHADQHTRKQAESNTALNTKAAKAIHAVAVENKGVEAEVQSVIDQAESVDKQKQTVKLQHRHGKVQVQGLAEGGGTNAAKAKALKPRKPKLSNETLEAMREGEQAGWAADEAAKKQAAIAAKRYYQELRKEMYKEAAEHEVKERQVSVGTGEERADPGPGLTEREQEILKRHSLSTSEDNADLVHALDAVYRSDGPTSTRGPLLTAAAPTSHSPPNRTPDAHSSHSAAPAPPAAPARAASARQQPHAPAAPARAPSSPTTEHVPASLVRREAAPALGTAPTHSKQPAFQANPLAFLDHLFGS